MLFTLEVLKAKHGDCLILHYGNTESPAFLLIDGGPSGVYDDFLKPRLKEIKTFFSPDAPLPLSMVMLSHLDDDHINGLCRLTAEMAADQRDHKPPIVSFTDLWLNSFDDIIGNAQLSSLIQLSRSNEAASIASLGIPEFTNAEHHIAAVIASTGQGRQLRDDADFLGITINNPFDPMQDGKAALVRGDADLPSIEWGDELIITVIHPNQKRLKKLQEKWDKDLELLRKNDDRIVFATMASPDNSPFNLSSIVCLLKLEGRSILLTGDARADDIYNGLGECGLLDHQGKLHVDIFKLPHHGSSRNMNRELLEKVTADNYVISADGRDENPDIVLLNLFAEHVLRGTLHLTYQKGRENLGNKIMNFSQRLINEDSAIKLNILEESGKSITINLLDKVSY